MELRVFTTSAFKWRWGCCELRTSAPTEAGLQLDPGPLVKAAHRIGLGPGGEALCY